MNRLSLVLKNLARHLSFNLHLFCKLHCRGLNGCTCNTVSMGHSTTPKNTLSKRCYSVPEMSFNDMFRKQNLELKQKFFERGESIDVQESKKLDEAFSFLKSKCISFKDAEDHDRLAFQIACSLGWPVDADFNALQFNFQHQSCSPHTDECGFLEPNLMRGDGFGKQIWHNIHQKHLV